ncbi:hypothetical protein BCR37DRAFT_382426 [Protomyces lactucae-debilis]|uniref:Uncharacterized protein n=1 Tax=Protomyces lactucae-debilis TaxID=2754530 RepID=A0A1Y2F2P8_PROLT|nr:uncharacterized protein BCR37DRAFT_382426 [Protomyces lactucae-debilis]ORY78168.1 hypothetical protein BCR37DRAFT_382426 [Protomyces lactucae-debilis]
MCTNVTTRYPWSNFLSASLFFPTLDYCTVWTRFLKFWPLAHFLLSLFSRFFLKTMLTLWIAIPLSLITLVAAGARRRPPADNSNCVSLVIEEARFISVNDTIGEWTCKQGELCQAPYAENAYSLSKTNFAWDKYNSAPDPCAVDGMPLVSYKTC